MHEFRLDYQTTNMDVLRKVPKRFQECAVSLGALPLAALGGRFNLQPTHNRLGAAADRHDDAGASVGVGPVAGAGKAARPRRCGVDQAALHRYQRTASGAVRFTKIAMGLMAAKYLFAASQAAPSLNSSSSAMVNKSLPCGLRKIRPSAVACEQRFSECQTSPRVWWHFMTTEGREGNRRQVFNANR
jgi:hypothetical protein